MKLKILKTFNIREHSIFIWMILIAIVAAILSTVFSNIKSEQTHQIKSSLDNIYLKKVIKEITSNLEPRYTTLQYVSKSGDTYQSIVNKLSISTDEKKVLLDNILNEKSLKILKINQKFSFKLDNLAKIKIIEFVIETDKKNEIYFSRSETEN